MTAVATRIRLVHWHDPEARKRVGTLEAAGYRVDYEPLYAMSSLWGVDDLSASIRAIGTAGQLGMDAIVRSHGRSNRARSLFIDILRGLHGVEG